MFFSTFLVIYILLNLYVYWRAFSALKDRGWWVVVLKILFLIFVLAYPALHSLEDAWRGGLYTALAVVGSLWVVAVFYFFMSTLILDGIGLLDRLIPVIPARLKNSPVLRGRAVFFGTIAAVALIVFFGWLNTRFVRVVPIEVALSDMPKAHNPTTVVFASDLHLGQIIDEKRLADFVETINSQNPDIILIGGDLFDGEVTGLDPMRPTLSRLSAPLGVFAVKGNHDRHGGEGETEAFMRSAGITVLKDETVTIPGIVNLIGLDDPRFVRTGTELPDLVKRGDPGLPTILLTHRPVNMEDYATRGIDLMLAGHSHHGQFFPLTIVTNYVYTISYGYGRIGPMQVYVTSGLGTWGPPVRILTSPEIARITLAHPGHDGRDDPAPLSD